MNESSCRVFNGFCYSKLSIEAICSMKLFRIVDCFNQPLSFLKLLKTNKTQSIRSGNSLSCQSVVRMKEKTPSANWEAQKGIGKTDTRWRVHGMADGRERPIYDKRVLRTRLMKKWEETRCKWLCDFDQLVWTKACVNRDETMVILQNVLDGWNTHNLDEWNRNATVKTFAPKMWVVPSKRLSFCRCHTILPYS